MLCVGEHPRSRAEFQTERGSSSDDDEARCCLHQRLLGDDFQLFLTLSKQTVHSKTYWLPDCDGDYSPGNLLPPHRYLHYRHLTKDPAQRDNLSTPTCKDLGSMLLLWLPKEYYSETYFLLVDTYIKDPAQRDYLLVPSNSPLCFLTKPSRHALSNTTLQPCRPSSAMFPNTPLKDRWEAVGVSKDDLSMKKDDYDDEERWEREQEREEEEELRRRKRRLRGAGVSMKRGGR